MRDRLCLFVPLVAACLPACLYVEKIQERDPHDFEIYQCPDQNCTVTVFLSTDTTFCPEPGPALEACLNQQVSPCPVQWPPVQAEGRDCCLDGCLRTVEEQDTAAPPCDPQTMFQEDCCDDSQENNFAVDPQTLLNTEQTAVATIWDDACVDGYVDVVDVQWSCDTGVEADWSDEECPDPTQARFWNGGTGLSVDHTESWFDLQGNLGPAGHRALTGSLGLDDPATPVVHGFLRSGSFSAQGNAFDYAEVHLLADGVVGSSGMTLYVEDTDITSLEVRLAENASSDETVAGVTVPASADFQFMIRPEGTSLGSTDGYDGLLDYELGEWWLHVEVGSPSNAVLIHLEGDLVSESLP